MFRSVKAWFRTVIKGHPLIRKITRKILYHIRLLDYKFCGLGKKVDSRLFIFQSFNGKNYSCNPKAIYEYLLTDDKYRNCRFVWAFNTPEEYEFLKKDKRTFLVKYGSREYKKLLAEAKYWVFNYRALDWYVPKSNQKYIQCWHGTPLKRLGYDIEVSGNAMNSKEEIEFKYFWDAKRFNYLVSPCKFSSEKFSSAWNLSKVGKEDAILEVGYPRNDFLVNYSDEDVVRIKGKLGLSKDNRKVILYAPTWRDDQHDSKIGYKYDLGVDFNKLRDALSDEYIILFRAHYLVANSFNFEDFEGFVYNVSSVDDINELYVVADMLITDYSSVFFDYAILNRPILFYMYDLDSYANDIRGFYMSLDELPGDIVTVEEDLIDCINGCSFDVNHKDFNEKFNYLNDGEASKRLADSCFSINNKKKPTPLVVNIFKRIKRVDDKLVIKGFSLNKIIVTKEMMDYSKLNVVIPSSDIRVKLNFLLKKGIPFIKKWRFNFYKFTLNIDDLLGLDIHNKLLVDYDDRYVGRIIYSAFDFKKGHNRTSKVFFEKGLSLYLRQTVQNTMYLTIRAYNQYDTNKGRLKVFLAYICSKFYFNKDIVLMYEKECQRYEESASVLYEKLIDLGYKNVYFVVNKDNPRIEGLDSKYTTNMIEKGSFKHIVYFFKSRKFIGTETVGHAMQLRASSKLIMDKVSSKKIQYIFLQHGVMYMISLDAGLRSGFRNNGLDLYRVVVSSELEAQHFIELGGFTRDELYVTGLAKYDRSYKNVDADKIVIMPTWRQWESNQARMDFTQTNYYKMIERIVNSIPKELDNKIVVLPHPLMKEAMENSDCYLNKYMSDEQSYDNILKDCDTLITDYSSISYDAFYRGSNIIFYWEEKDECLVNYGGDAKLLLNEGTAFGDVCYKPEDVSDVVALRYGNTQLDEYIERYKNIVSFDDGCNCDRIVKKLMEDKVI